MRKEAFHHGWRFGFAPSEAWVNRVPGKADRPVTLPHDFKLELPRTPDTPAGASEAFYPGGVGYYEKTFTADGAMCEGQALLLFDGAYRLTSVRLNRSLIATHSGGYTPFFADLTGKLQPGENHLLVTVDASLLPASRWYSGAGLYRGVALLTGGPAAIKPWGVCVRTPSLDTVEVAAEINAPEGDAYTLRYAVLDENGQTLADAEAAPGASATLHAAGVLPWHPDAPVLYTLRSALLRGADVLDACDTPFGFRTVQLSPACGLLLNGQPLLLKGGCVHHDNGILGAKSHPDAEWRKAQRLKDCGYNAVRCAHNPPADAFLDACDALGLLVIDEAFDCWCEGKRQLDDHIFFEAHWAQELEAMILRDRNHPSVILWSTGNEIVERSGISDGAAWARRLADTVRRLDPTRPVNNAVCGFFEDPEVAEMAANSRSTAGDGKDFWAARSEDFIAPLDAVGYNYLLDRYEKDHALFPARVFIGTESFPAQALDNWRAVRRLPYLLGDFVWTAWDYLGESGIGHTGFDGPTRGLRPFPWHLANCGDIDICGNKRPQSHYRDFVWSDRRVPYIATQHPSRFGQEEHLSPWGWPDILPGWNYAGHEGRPVLVTVYAQGDAVTLQLNGETVGSAPCGEAHRYTATFAVPYRPGTLRAIATQGDAVTGEAVLHTTGEPAALRMLPEKAAAFVPADGLLYVRIEAVDAQGLCVPDAAVPFAVAVEGGFSLFALGCADPVGDQAYTDSRCHTHQGCALAVLRRIAPGEGVLRLSAEGLPDAHLSL